MAVVTQAPARDLRLDFFRGLALFFIFFDHIPGNVFSYLTLQSFAFSNAAEAFIFISGYTVALVYGSALLRHGALYASARIYHRVGQLYVAHIFLFVIFIAEVSYTAARFHNPLYSDEMRISEFLSEPHDGIVNALVLRFQPAFLDILPLYIVILAAFPIAVIALARSPWLALIPSGVLYVATQTFGFTVHGFPAGHAWFFNPFAWQFLFVIGSTCGFRHLVGGRVMPNFRWPFVAAGAIVAAAVIIKLSWTLHTLDPGLPALFIDRLWPMAADKTNLSPLRLINFLAVAIVVVRVFPADSKLFNMRWANPVIRCGQHSLQVFCLGILLSALGHFLLAELHGGIALQVAVNLAGCGAMVGTASLIAWYKKVNRAAEPPPARVPRRGWRVVPVRSILARQHRARRSDRRYA
jgi:hypothetical protein